MRPRWHSGPVGDGWCVGWARFGVNESWQPTCRAIDFWTCSTKLILLALHASELSVLPCGEHPGEWGPNNGHRDNHLAALDTSHGTLGQPLGVSEEI